MVRENSAFFNLIMSNTGYKAMLRDRVPYVVNLALLWCNSKGSWINHVYEMQIAIYVNKKDRDDATRHVLGLKKHNKGFNFHESIDWGNLSADDKAKWKDIEAWVTWFQVHHMYIKYICDCALAKGEKVDTIKESVKKYLSSSVDPSLWDKLVTFLINNLVYE